MTESPHPLDFSHLSVPERVQLAQELWESVFHQTDSIALTEEQKRELARRWKAFEAGHMTTAPWSEVIERILAR